MATIPPDQLAQMDIYVGDPDRLTHLAGAGSVLLEDERAWWSESVGFLIADYSEALLAQAQALRQTVLEATVHQDEDPHITAPMLQTITFVAVARDDEDFGTVAAFWNFRALRPRGHETGSSILLNFGDARSVGVLHALREAALLAATTPRIALLSDSLSDDDLWSLVDFWQFERHTESTLSERIAATGPFEGPISVGMIDPRTGWLVDRRTGRTAEHEVLWSRPVTNVSVSSPVTWSPGHFGRGQVCVSLAGAQFDVPRTPGTARAYHQNADWDAGALRLMTNPWVRYDFPIGLPTAAEVLAIVLGEHGATSSSSDKATQINGVLAATHDRGIFRRSPVISTVRALTMKTRRDLLNILKRDAIGSDDALAQIMAAIEPSNGLQFAAVVDRSNGTGAQDVSDALDTLVREGFVERGFQTYCRLCGLKLFSPLQAAGGSPRCSGCGSVASLTSEKFAEPTIHYRLGSLLQRLSLNGGLAPLAATCLLLDEGSYVVPGANLKRGDDPSGEVDLIGWRGGTVFAGEAKMSAAGFAAHDLLADMMRAHEIGADQYLLICLEQLSDDLLTHATELASTVGVALRVMGPDSLVT